MSDNESEENLNLLNLMGLGEFSGKKNYYHEMEREKIQFERIFSEAINGILQVDLSGNIIICNPAFWKMCGYVDYRDLTVCCNSVGDDIFASKCEFSKIVEIIEAKDKLIGYEVLLKRSDGQTFYVSLDGHMQNDSGSTFLEFFVQDIDKRKKAEHEIEEGRLFVNNIIDASTLVSIISTDLDGTITKFNRGAEEMLGYKASEVEGVETPALIHLEEEVTKRGEELSKIYNEDISGFEVFIRKAKVEGSEAREWTYVKKSGERITVNLSVTAIRGRNEELIGYLGVAKDVTQEKRIQKELQEVQNIVTGIIDSMPSYIIGVDSFISITHWNRQLENHTGVKRISALGGNPFELYPPLVPYQDEIVQSIDSEKVYLKSNVQIFEGSDKKYKDITVYPLSIEGFKGGVIRVDDVTERVKLEELIVQSEKMLSVGGLAAGMAHEINNPLAGIIQNSQNMHRRLFDPISKNISIAEKLGISYDSVKKYLIARNIDQMLDGISESGKRAAKIVKNMLSFSRKSNDDFIETSIVQLLDSTITLAQSDFNLKKNFDFKSVEIIREFGDDIPDIQCEPSKIQQVLYNLIKNGTEAMYGSTSQPKLIFRIYEDGKWVIIEVEDNGHGMTDAVRKRIFEPFFTTKDVGQGTGLGMSVSYFIICDLHHGELSVESELSKMTKFIIKLPIEE